jgi:hypothetical protein
MAEIDEVVLDERGRIHVPDELSRRLGLQEGTVLVVERRDEEGAVLRRAELRAGLVEEDGLLLFDAEPEVDVATGAIRKWGTSRSRRGLSRLPPGNEGVSPSPSLRAHEGETPAHPGHGPVSRQPETTRRRIRWPKA